MWNDRHFRGMNILIIRQDMPEPTYEIVERKGRGHPDTLADALAEHLSVEYSKWTENSFGAILHHNFDKVGILGGAASVRFGKGALVGPIRILLNGRASSRFGDRAISLETLLPKWAKEFMVSEFPVLDRDRDLVVQDNISTQSSPGNIQETNARKGTRQNWFTPRGLEDLQERTTLASNDTSLGVGYAPMSRLEESVLDIEAALSMPRFRRENPWIGSDIKIMAYRKFSSLHLTMCIPQIADHVPSERAYRNNLAAAQAVIEKLLEPRGYSSLEISLNTRDNFAASELYLTAIGSSIESGDEGLVGRGNRVNGLITPMRPMSMEGACGKNPVYHIGKLYNVLSDRIAKRLHGHLGIQSEVAMIGQSGRLVRDPWQVVVKVPMEIHDTKDVQEIVEQEVLGVANITALLLAREITLF
jgi:S-adenosylmethionine synthetase